MTQTAHAPVVDRIKLERGWLVGIAIVAILLGLVGFFFPGASLLTIAILFGIYLVASGVYRVSSAVTPGAASGGVRVLTGLLGGLIIVAGIVCLSNPFYSVFALGTAIGIGWILEGALYLALLSTHKNGRKPWQLVASAILALVAGIVMLLLPIAGITTLVLVGSVALVLLGVVALINLPKAP